MVFAGDFWLSFCVEALRSGVTNWPVVQLEERLTLTQEVAGSSPARPTNKRYGEARNGTDRHKAGAERCTLQIEERPVAWDASLGRGLDRVHIDGSRSLDDVAHATMRSLRRMGFALLDGLATPEDKQGSSRLEVFGQALGRIVPQSPRGELIEDVRDMSDREASDDRGYRSRGELAPHSDPPTLLVLHCVRAAKSGGESHLVSVAAICDALAAADPTALETLREPFPRWCVEGQYGMPAGPEGVFRPVLTSRGGVPSCLLYRPFIEKAAAALGAPLTSVQTSALDSSDRHSHDARLALRFTLAPGQTLVLHNRSVLHARTDYEDWPEFERRRHLKRLWIDAPEALPVDPRHELGDLFEQRGR